MPISALPAPLPCPFCGHTDVVIGLEDSEICAFVHCGHCGAEAGWSTPDPSAGINTKEDCTATAARWWNTRSVAHDLPPRADLARHLEEQNQALINACAVVAIAQGQITAAQNEREDASVGEDAA